MRLKPLVSSNGSLNQDGEALKSILIVTLHELISPYIIGMYSMRDIELIASLSVGNYFDVLERFRVIKSNSDDKVSELDDADEFVDQIKRILDNDLPDDFDDEFFNELS